MAVWRSTFIAANAEKACCFSRLGWRLILTGRALGEPIPGLWRTPHRAVSTKAPAPLSDPAHGRSLSPWLAALLSGWRISVGIQPLLIIQDGQRGQPVDDLHSLETDSDYAGQQVNNVT